LATDPTCAQLAELDALLDAVQREMERDLERAADLATSTAEIARSHSSVEHEGRALHQRGWARFGLGEMAGAVSDQLAAVNLLKSCSDERGVGRCLHALGGIYDTIGEPLVGVEHYEQAIEIQSRIGDNWGEARTRNGLAIVMAEDEQHSEAVEAFRDVADRFAEAGDEWWMLMADANRCETQLEWIKSGKLTSDDAEIMSLEVLAECDRIISRASEMGEPGRSVEIYARQCRAGILYEHDDPQGSLDEVQATMPMATRAGDATILVDLELHAVRALEALGGGDEVFLRLDHAEELARSAGRDRHVAKSLDLRADLCEARGDLKAALDAHRRYHELKTGARRTAEEMRAKVIRSLLDTQRAEHELALARAEVANLESVARERRRMVSVIAHELRNPITTVVGLSSEMTACWDQLGDERKQLIEIIRDEAEDLAEIVEDLLSIESLDRGSIQVDVGEFDLRPLAQAVIERAQLGEKTALIEGDVVAQVDPVRFRQILRNLVSNAVRYGGDRVVVKLNSEVGKATVEVIDDGPGVPDEDSEAIFEPYRRASGGKHEAKSVGLGLAVTRQLARLMGGDVVYARRGCETVFRLTVPSAGVPSDS
jgi:signal transduction histidine kinase